MPDRLEAPAVQPVDVQERRAKGRKGDKQQSQMECYACCHDVVLCLMKPGDNYAEDAAMAP